MSLVNCWVVCNELNEDGSIARRIVQIGLSQRDSYAFKVKQRVLSSNHLADWPVIWMTGALPLLECHHLWVYCISLTFYQWRDSPQFVQIWFPPKKLADTMSHGREKQLVHKTCLPAGPELLKAQGTETFRFRNSEFCLKLAPRTEMPTLNTLGVLFMACGAEHHWHDQFP
jgi:hypothetical protein